MWIEPLVEKSSKKITYRIRNGGTRQEIDSARSGTKVGRGKFRCLLSDSAILPDYLKSTGRSGKMSQTLIAIVAEGNKGRIYLTTVEKYEHVALSLSSRVSKKPEILQPDNPPFSPPAYGMENFGDLFTERQLGALTIFSDLVDEARNKIYKDALAAGMSDDPTPLRDEGTGAQAYAEAISVYLAFVVSKCGGYWSSICTWDASRQQIRNTFTRQAIPIVWEYAEANPFSSSSGNWMSMCDWVWKSIARLVPNASGDVIQHDAQSVTFPKGSVISMDPPYYDNIGYADLSDFFYCWLKPLLKPIYPELFSFLATPKSEELVAARYRHGGKLNAERFFLEGMKETFTNFAQQTLSNIPMTVYYAFKQSEISQEGVSSTGWSTFLQAVIETGYAVVATWPMRTEMNNRMVAIGKNALANSIVLVCRKREPDAGNISHSEFIRELKKELPRDIKELQKAHISPADMPQSAIGSGMRIFSSYNTILEANDTKMSVKTALQMINQELDEYLNEVQGDFDDETRFAIIWFEQNGLLEGEYGIANNIATARGISVERVKKAGIVESTGGKVRILERKEIDSNGPLTAEKDFTVWVSCQCLVHALEQGGETAAASLLRKIPSHHADSVKDLAYCLHNICANKRQNAAEAVSYNALISVWPALQKQAQSIDANAILPDEIGI